MTIGNVLNYYFPSVKYIFIEDKKENILEDYYYEEITKIIRELKVSSFKPYGKGIWFVLSTL